MLVEQKFQTLFQLRHAHMRKDTRLFLPSLLCLRESGNEATTGLHGCTVNSLA